MQLFEYIPSRKISGWGCQFDSLTEFKFAISIMDEYEFLRSRVSIYYDPKTKISSEYIREYYRRYTPDFLIRHKETLAATLVEIKPRAFANEPQLVERTQVAENYIARKGYDWKFKVVFDDEIILTAEQLADFDHLCRNVRACDYKTWWDDYHQRSARGTVQLFSYVPSNSSIEFVMFGTRSPSRQRLGK